MQPLTPDELASLLIRRYCLTHSLGFPGSTAQLLLLILAALAGLFFLCMLLQGPGRFLSQVLDLPAHVRQFRRGAALVSANYRPLVVLLGAAVISWSLSDLYSWNEPAETAVQETLLSGKSSLRLAVDHALLVAVQPQRDLTALALYLPLLFALCLRLLSGENLDHALRAARIPPADVWRWRSRITFVWLAMLLLTAHRLFAWIPGLSGPPLATCLVIDVLYLPLLTCLADAVLLGWVLSELRRARLGTPHEESRDIAWMIRAWPSLCLICLLAQPARYLALFYQLASAPLPWLLSAPAPPTQPAPPPPGSLAAPAGTPLVPPSTFLWLCLAAQLVALLFIAAPAVAPASYSVRSTLLAYWTFLKTSAGRIYGMLIVGGALAGASTVLCYLFFFLMPLTPWRLLAAETYAHYATLTLGLILLAALFDLAADTLDTQPETPADAEILPDPVPVSPPASTP